MKVLPLQLQAKAREAQNGAQKSPVFRSLSKNRSVFQSPPLYYGVAYFYSSHPQIHRVVWAVKSKRLAKRIYAILNKTEPEAIHMHNFILVRDLLKRGWDSIMIGGTERGKTCEK